MSSKLKRKLNDLGVDTSSRTVTENFCLIGTPLPPLEKSKDNGEFVPIWKQEVRDEKGRRRLHGAFTGGFSAGYFNTVGSKEGWAPSTFVSSRSDRAKKKAARPEDFMDEEDLAEIRDNQKLVGSTDEMDTDFWSRGSKTEGKGEEDSITSALEAALLPAPRDSVGARILKKMGWRMGHGIGPRVSYEQRKRQTALAHDTARDNFQPPSGEDHEEAKKHLYPPRDTKVPSFSRKDDKHGLGYKAGLGLTDLVSAEATAGKTGKVVKGPNISTGFGLGALNEADEDDLDVYDRGFDSGTHRVAFEEEADDQQYTIGSRNKTRPGAKPVLRPSLATNKPVGQQFAFSDGTPCLPGFVVSTRKVIEEAWFPPPKVPENWTPNPRKVWEQGKENLEKAENLETRKDVQSRMGLTHAERGDLLGEAPQGSRSVFDYLKPEDRERLQNLKTDRGRHEQSQEEPGPMPPTEPEPTIPRLDPQIAKMALQGFQPFTTDPVKQSRYTAFLRAQAEAEDSVPFGRMPGQAADAFQRELEDYARSAQIFKPVSGAMAGRFARAKVFESGPQAQEGLHRPTNENSYLSVPSDNKEEEKPKEESPKENAARLGMYGALTREVKPWRPARLLCKRFGVKEPEIEPEAESTTASASFAAANNKVPDTLAITDGAESALTGSTQIRGDGDVPDPSASSGPRWSGRDIENIGLGENEQQGKEILSYQRPAMDIFKAIFASDDEDEVDEEGQEDETSKLNGDGFVKEPSETPAPNKASDKVANIIESAGSVDLASFKPTFVPRADRQKGDEKKKEKSKHKDKDRKKKSKSTLMSFDVEEDGGDVLARKDHDRERSEKRMKKKERKEAVVDDEDDSMWVEKPAPEAVQNLPTRAPLEPQSTSDRTEREAGPQRGRKRAVDFL